MSVGALIVLGAILICTIAMVWIALRLLPLRQADQQQSMLKVFGSAVELRCPGREGLTERVADLCVAVGRELGLGAADLRQVEQAARLRDIGLCAIPWKLVNERSPQDWTAAERATFERHTEVSGAMLEMVPSLCDLAPIVRHHHAPLTADAPLASRIIAVGEAYVERERSSGHLVARSFLLAECGESLEKRVVEACLRVLPSERGSVR